MPCPGCPPTPAVPACSPLQPTPPPFLPACAQLNPPAEACSLADLASGAVAGDVLVNTTSVGMHPQVGEGWVFR